jgi:hypothetical protein
MRPRVADQTFEKQQMIDFDDVHRRYWRDQRGNRDAVIPVRAVA